MAEPQGRQALYQTVTRAARIGLLCNLILGGIKLAGGIIGNSVALMADAFNSMGDVSISIVVLFSLWVAQKPADKEHPYGHTRAEAIAASNISLFIVLGALWVGWQAIQSLFLLHENPPVWTLGIAGGNVVAKEILYRYKHAVGQRTGSGALIANAWDHRADALCSLAVLAGLSMVRFGGPSLIWADEAAALIVVAIIAWSAVHLYCKGVHDLLDPQAEDAILVEVTQTASSVASVQAVEKLRLRKSGLEFFAEIHIQVDPDLTVSSGHQIGHHVKDALLSRHPYIRDVLVHLEPVDCPKKKIPSGPSSA